jgi:phage gpG-like protein
VASIARKRDASRVRGPFGNAQIAGTPPHPTRLRWRSGGPTSPRTRGEVQQKTNGMFDLSLNDTASAALAGLPKRIAVALAAKAEALAAALQAKIQQKLSGDVLAMKSGALAGSIGATIDASSAGVAVRIVTSPDVKYAAIHEFGGTIPPHQIVPEKAKALAFLVGGKQVFAARVNLPPIAMPQRSYMRSSLAEMADEIRGELGAAVSEAMQ